MARPQWFIDLIKKSFPSRFSIARLTHYPWIGALTDKLVFEGDDLFYLPGDQTIPINQPIETSVDVVLPSQVVDHFIEKSDYHWLMNFCICRESDACHDYPREYGCLFLGEAVVGINPNHGRLVTREEAFEHVARCREAGLIHLVGRNKLDTLWLGVGPGDRLLTICNCCPCCCLWKMLPDLSPMIGDKVQKMPGVSVRVSDQCAGCGACVEDVCFVNAIYLIDDRAHIDTGCRGCGRCVEVCPNGAIELTIADQSYAQDAIDRLDPLVYLS